MIRVNKILVLALLTLSGCDALVALCNAGGFGTPEQCTQKWDPCAARELACASGDAAACEELCDR